MNNDISPKQAAERLAERDRKAVDSFNNAWSRGIEESIVFVSGRAEDAMSYLYYALNRIAMLEDRLNRLEQYNKGPDLSPTSQNQLGKKSENIVNSDT